MGMCYLAGSFKELSLSISDSGSSCNGALEYVRFRQAPNMPRHNGVFSAYARPESEPLDFSVVTINILKDAGATQYYCGLILPRERYKAFERLAAKYLGQDIIFTFGFEYPDDAEGEGSIKQLLKGEPFILRKFDLKVMFRGREAWNAVAV